MGGLGVGGWVRGVLTNFRGWCTQLISLGAYQEAPKYTSLLSFPCLTFMYTLAHLAINPPYLLLFFPACLLLPFYFVTFGSFSSS